LLQVGLGYLSSFGLSARVNVVGHSGWYLRGDEPNLFRLSPAS
jgi:hypothetical protein